MQTCCGFFCFSFLLTGDSGHAHQSSHQRPAFIFCHHRHGHQAGESSWSPVCPHSLALLAVLNSSTWTTPPSQPPLLPCPEVVWVVHDSCSVLSQDRQQKKTIIKGSVPFPWSPTARSQLEMHCFSTGFLFSPFALCGALKRHNRWGWSAFLQYMGCVASVGLPLAGL